MNAWADLPQLTYYYLDQLNFTIILGVKLLICTEKVVHTEWMLIVTLTNIGKLLTVMVK